MRWTVHQDAAVVKEWRVIITSQKQEAFVYQRNRLLARFQRDQELELETVMDMIIEPYRLTRRSEVTAILILYGLPRYCKMHIIFLLEMIQLL
ncbi:hypothetical protein ZIOFF_050228 [Zingiber officinale]|uniref:Protein DA1-like domain-containing protein n=1 Tax=Zingiber officinale TaxID=94328 RepID=A0A8J5KGB5_ZINOF|nr:hypothetical protein ZIOFF_050228 [Zingiber officinale]